MHNSFKQMLFYFFKMLSVVTSQDVHGHYQFDLYDHNVVFNKYLNLMEPVI